PAPPCPPPRPPGAAAPTPATDPDTPGNAPRGPSYVPGRLPVGPRVDRSGPSPAGRPPARHRVGGPRRPLRPVPLRPRPPAQRDPAELALRSRHPRRARRAPARTGPRLAAVHPHGRPGHPPTRLRTLVRLPRHLPPARAAGPRQLADRLRPPRPHRRPAGRGAFPPPGRPPAPPQRP